MTSPVVEASPIAFSASDFSDLPPAVEEKPDSRPDAVYCPVCTQEIVRDPSWKRMRKYHPSCKPSVGQRISATTGGVRGPRVRDARKAAEADECVSMYKAAMVKLAMGVAMVDRFDGFCIMAALPDSCANLRALLIIHDKFRKDILAMKDGGSWFGFVLSFLMMGVPIAAHHGLIPSPKVAQLLTNLPVTMYRIRTQMAEGEAALTDMLGKMAAGMDPTAQTPATTTPRESDGN